MFYLNLSDVICLKTICGIEWFYKIFTKWVSHIPLKFLVAWAPYIREAKGVSIFGSKSIRLTSVTIFGILPPPATRRL